MNEREEPREPPPGVIEHRSAELVSVDEPKRVITLIVMPYETPTTVAHEGRVVREIVSRGAFDGIERRANRIRVNRDHEASRTVGRALALHPSRKEGLVGDLRIARTVLGDETLALAEEGILDASAGFLPMPGGEQWEGRSLRRLTKVWLAHIAMTPDPAYEGARVLAVRQREAAGTLSATPNLDLVRSWRQADRYPHLSR